MITAPTTAQRNVSAIAQPVGDSTDVVTMASMVDNSTRAVASLTRPSPSRIVTMRGGRPSRLPRLVAATASGGATTAPSAIARASGIAQIRCTITPTSTADTTTSTMARNPITRRLRRKSTNGTCRAAAYSSGGRITVRTMSGSISKCGTTGMAPTPTPTTVSASGAATPMRPEKNETTPMTSTTPTTTSVTS